MGFSDFFHRKKYEYCRRCNANLTMQKGYSNSLPYWECRGCGEMLINPDIPTDTDIAWFCDECEEMLNIQEGWHENCGQWTCTKCGHVNPINNSEVYSSEDEYQQELNNPYHGMSDESVIELMQYEEVKSIDDRNDIFLVKNISDGKLYVKKILSTYDISVYEYLWKNPISHMPSIISLYSGEKHLIIIEEYIEGDLLSSMLDRGRLDKVQAIDIAKQLCVILHELHSQPSPIVHRDVKPGNIIVTNNGDVYLLDINVAKWYKADEIEDTRLLGTPHFAAPEQFGYGLSSSSTKADIYALGVLINMMVTGKLPKEKRVTGELWKIVEKCISMTDTDRYSANELLEALNRL